MKYLNRLLFALAIPALFLVSCKNDLEVVDEYKEIPVIYGLINPNLKVNYVRLERAYLGIGNALIMAQQPDSIYYDTNLVDLRLIAIRGGIEKEAYSLYPSFEVPRNEGVFTDVNPMLYKLVMRKTNGDTIKLDASAQFKLQFTNKATGKVVTSVTKIIEPLNVINYGSGTTYPKMNLASKNPYQIKVLSSKNAKFYGMIFRFNYVEFNNTTNQRTAKHVDFYLDDLLSRTTSGGQEIIFFLDGKEILQYIGNHVPKDTTVTRSTTLLSADFVFTAGTTDLYNYIQINKPSNTVDYVPDFTNLSEGKGIFTCRIDTNIRGVQFTDATIDSLYNSPYTKHIFEN
jgi:hypothetical protein